MKEVNPRSNRIAYSISSRKQWTFTLYLLNLKYLWNTHNTRSQNFVSVSLQRILIEDSKGDASGSLKTENKNYREQRIGSEAKTELETESASWICLVWYRGAPYQFSKVLITAEGKLRIKCMFPLSPHITPPWFPSSQFSAQILLVQKNFHSIWGIVCSHSPPHPQLALSSLVCWYQYLY